MVIHSYIGNTSLARLTAISEQNGCGVWLLAHFSIIIPPGYFAHYITMNYFEGKDQTLGKSSRGRMHLLRTLRKML
jgi:hypothetical protein